MPGTEIVGGTSLEETRGAGEAHEGGQRLGRCRVVPLPGDAGRLDQVHSLQHLVAAIGRRAGGQHLETGEFRLPGLRPGRFVAPKVRQVHGAALPPECRHEPLRPLAAVHVIGPEFRDAGERLGQFRLAEQIAPVQILAVRHEQGRRFRACRDVVFFPLDGIGKPLGYGDAFPGEPDSGFEQCRPGQAAEAPVRRCHAGHEARHQHGPGSGPVGVVGNRERIVLFEQRVVARVQRMDPAGFRIVVEKRQPAREADAVAALHHRLRDGRGQGGVHGIGALEQCLVARPHAEGGLEPGDQEPLARHEGALRLEPVVVLPESFEHPSGPVGRRQFEATCRSIHLRGCSRRVRLCLRIRFTTAAEQCVQR